MKADRQARLRALLFWAVLSAAWWLALSPPSWPPHAAVDWRLSTTPLLLPALCFLRGRWQSGALVLGGIALLGLTLQSLWSRTDTLISLGVIAGSVALLLLTWGGLRRARNPAVLPVLALGIGLVVAVDSSVRLGQEAMILGALLALFRGRSTLLGGAVLAMLPILGASVAYADAERVLPLILLAALSPWVTGGRGALKELLGVLLPLGLATIPGLLELKEMAG